MDDTSHVRSAEAELTGSVTWLRDEEAAGSNPATPTIKLQVAACFRNQYRPSVSAKFRFWEQPGADLDQIASDHRRDGASCVPARDGLLHRSGIRLSPEQTAQVRTYQTAGCRFPGPVRG